VFSSAAYFNDRIIEVGADGYLPTEQDVLRSRVRTTGIVENEFEIDGNLFKMFDVRNQHAQRREGWKAADCGWFVALRFLFLIRLSLCFSVHSGRRTAQ